MAATIKDIAAAAGVSRGTVDRVLHGRGDVSAAVRDRVLRLAEELNYRPNRAALGLAALKKPVRIGLLLPSEGNPFFDEVIRGARAASAPPPWTCRRSGRRSGRFPRAACR